MATLVSYASPHGATEGIAKRIPAHIAQSRATAVLRHVDAVQLSTGSHESNTS